jgi:hypothetical protein
MGLRLGQCMYVCMYVCVYVSVCMRAADLNGPYGSADGCPLSLPLSPCVHVPEKPGVPRATMARLTSAARGTFFVCRRRICSRPRTSGSGTVMWRSKRPGRTSALSSSSGKLVAPITITPSDDVNLTGTASAASGQPSHTHTHTQCQRYRSVTHTRCRRCYRLLPTHPQTHPQTHARSRCLFHPRCYKGLAYPSSSTRS